MIHRRLGRHRRPWHHPERLDCGRSLFIWISALNPSVQSGGVVNTLHRRINIQKYKCTLVWAYITTSGRTSDPELFCGLRNVSWLSIYMRMVGQWLSFHFYVSLNMHYAVLGRKVFIFDWRLNKQTDLKGQNTSLYCFTLFLHGGPF